MQLSLRTRLTAWYAVLLVLTVVLFSSAVLWLHWRLLLDQVDDGLQSIGETAGNVVHEELGELRDLPRAATEMAVVVRPLEGAVAVLDESGRPLHQPSRPMPLPAALPPSGSTAVTETLRDGDGQPWRVEVRRGSTDGYRYFVAVGTPLEEAVREWRVLLRACAVGIPVAALFAVTGGLWLGRHGLKPLTSLAAQAQAITAQTPDMRLDDARAAVELAQLASSFNHVLDRLGSALATQRRFMADASHELRTPLSILRTAADVTLSQPERCEAEYREALTAIGQQASRLTRLVEDMLVLARADGGGYPIRWAQVDMRDLVEECILERNGLAHEKGIIVQATVSTATLDGDEALLRRLFCNLLDNALMYSPRGSEVRVSLEATADRLTLRVADSGAGIRPEDRERVFERFVRLDAARGPGGAGLGLAIARWIAELHGGRLVIVPDDRPGTTFAADLPRHASGQA